MFKKTKVRGILELLGKDLSAREVSKVLGVSRNTVSEVQALYEASGKSWDDISPLDDDRLYDLFYPNKFKYKIRYAAVDYPYVHKELKKTGVTLKLLWEEYCDKCKEEGVKACSYIRCQNHPARRDNRVKVRLRGGEHRCAAKFPPKSDLRKSAPRVSEPSKIPSHA